MFLKISPKADRLYYRQLEHGARYLAGEAECAVTRAQHLGMAERYARLAGRITARGES